MNKELKTLLIASLILSIVFGFNDNLKSFDLANYLLNLIKFFILSFIALVIHNKIQKYYSSKVGATTKLSLWSSKLKFRVERYRKKVILHSGVIFPLLITLLSRGQAFFAAVVSTEIIVKPAYRIGRKYLKLTEFEHAKIAVIAPLAHIVIASVSSMFNISLLDDFALVNTMLAISTMLPIPGLLGATTFFSSKPLYVFSITFILAAALLSEFLSIFSTILLAIVLALTALILYFWRRYK